MLLLLIDMAVIWFLLNWFSERSWDEHKLKIFMIALSIGIAGGIASVVLVPYIGFYFLGVYVLIGGLILRLTTDLDWQKSFKAMGIFLSYRIVITLIFFAMIQNAPG